MGTFRTLLALAVVLFHCGGIAGYSSTGGMVSVQAFYIISGFYMSFILNEKYIAGRVSLSLFYTNRLFRVMPAYYFFLAIQLLLSFICLKYNRFPYQTEALSHFMAFSKILDRSSLMFLLFSDFMVLGQDLCLFLAVNMQTGLLHVSQYSWLTPPELWRFNFIPPAWTLSLELCFYAIAPFIVRRKASFISLLICLSFLLRYVLSSKGYNQLYWAYAFFPTEIAFFLLGAIAYKLFCRMKAKTVISPKISCAVWLAVMLATLWYPLFPATSSLQNFLSDDRILYFSFVTLALPFLFTFSAKHAWDRFIGELSFPIYLCHFIIIQFFGAPNVSGKSLPVITAIVLLSILFSIFAYVVIIRPIDRYRQTRLGISLS